MKTVQLVQSEIIFYFYWCCEHYKYSLSGPGLVRTVQRAWPEPLLRGETVRGVFMKASVSVEHLLPKYKLRAPPQAPTSPWNWKHVMSIHQHFSTLVYSHYTVLTGWWFGCSVFDSKFPLWKSFNTFYLFISARNKPSRRLKFHNHWEGLFLVLLCNCKTFKFAKVCFQL